MCAACAWMSSSAARRTQLLGGARCAISTQCGSAGAGACSGCQATCASLGMAVTLGAQSVCRATLIWDVLPCTLRHYRTAWLINMMQSCIGQALCGNAPDLSQCGRVFHCMWVTWRWHSGRHDVALGTAALLHVRAISSGTQVLTQLRPMHVRCTGWMWTIWW